MPHLTNDHWVKLYYEDTSRASGAGATHAPGGA